MTETGVGRAAAIARAVILIILSTLFGLSFLVSSLLGLPYSLGLPIVMRIVGGTIVASALGIIAWLFKYRRPSNMIVSTYSTFSKIFRRSNLGERVVRTESLILNGPQKYVRHPLYFGIIMLVFGWGLLTNTKYVIVASGVLLIWFRFVLIPFEEKELCALFGDQYKKYTRDTPMLFPFTKPKHQGNKSRQTSIRLT